MNRNPLNDSHPSLRLRLAKVAIGVLAGLALFAGTADAQVRTSTGQSAITTVACNTANRQIVVAPSMTPYWDASGRAAPMYAKAWLWSYASRSYVYQSVWTPAGFQQGSSIVITAPSGYYAVYMQYFWYTSNNSTANVQGGEWIGSYAQNVGILAKPINQTYCTT